MTPFDYIEQTIDYAEYIGVAHYTCDFRAEDVARSFHGAMATCYGAGLSPRFAAIILFSLTIEKVMEIYARRKDMVN